MPNDIGVAASAAPSQLQVKPEWPCRVLQGWKWSEHMAWANPASAARCACRSKAEGACCSCEQWKPRRGAEDIDREPCNADAFLPVIQTVWYHYVFCDKGIGAPGAVVPRSGRRE